MGKRDNYAELYLEGTMDGWYLDNPFGQAAKGAHWITFILLSCCTLFLFRDSWKATGPSGKERFYAGYHEEYNISLFVNLFAMIAYFGKIVADSLDHNYVNVGPLIIGLGNYRYADYMLTCPLLAYDLLSQVRAPYKITGAVLIFSVLMTGAATNFYPGEEMRKGALAWFGFGCFLYLGAYYLFFTVVKAQYERLLAMAAATEAKKAFLPLRLAVYTFFTIWVVFPVVWVLGAQGFGIINDEVQEVLHCICDIVAKSFYGFALARYRSYFDKKLFAVLEALGYDGEEELAHLEKDLKAMDKENMETMSSTLGYAARRLSQEWSRDEHRNLARRPSTDRWEGYDNSKNLGHLRELVNRSPTLEHPGQASPGRRFSLAGRPVKPMQKSVMAVPGLSVDQLRAQLDMINLQLRAVESESGPAPFPNHDKDDLRVSGKRVKSPKKLQSRTPDGNSSDSGAELQLVGDQYSHYPALTPRSGGQRRRDTEGDEVRGLC